jgi:membrane-associated phospholipid phosphatase
MWNLCRGDRRRVWILVTTVVFAAQITAIASIFVPAEGAIIHLGLDALHGQGLPQGAGSYSAAEFSRFYWGSDLVVKPGDIAGIVVFPSFHTVMALLILQGFLRTRLRPLGMTICIATIVSTVPMGGHYVIDLFGGLLVWAASYVMATRACNGMEPRASGDCRETSAGIAAADHQCVNASRPATHAR